MNTTVDTEGKVDFKAIQSGLTPEQKSRKKRLIMVRTKIFCVLPLLVVLNLLVACHKTDCVAPEIEFSVNDTVEYYFDQEYKARFVCTVNCDSPVDSVWWVWIPDGWEDCGTLMRKTDEKYVYEICPFVGLSLDYYYCLSINDFRYHSKCLELNVLESDLDSILP